MKKQSLITPLTLLCFFMTILMSAQDWANLKRYQEENSKLELATADRIVFMGNSITEAWSKHQPRFFNRKNYINRGISGQTTPQMLLRFRQDVINLNPKVVVILAGTNDIAENTGPTSLTMIVNHIKSMVDIARSNKIKVVISSVLPAVDYPWRKGLKPNKKIPALNALLSAYAKKQGIVYLDYFSAMVNNENGLTKTLTYDGVHPNKKGYLVMAPLAEKAIKKALAQN